MDCHPILHLNKSTESGVDNGNLEVLDIVEVQEAHMLGSIYGAIKKLELAKREA